MENEFANKVAYRLAVWWKRLRFFVPRLVLPLASLVFIYDYFSCRWMGGDEVLI